MNNPKFKNIVESLEKVKNSPRYDIGDIIFCQDTKKTYVKTLLNWEEIDVKQSISAGTLYDLNKDAISQMKPLNEKEINQLKEKINDFVKKTDNDFYMLLSREFNYFTVFTQNKHQSDYQYCGAGVIDVLQYFSEIITYDIYENQQIEIWIKEKDDTYYFVFFPYDAGVVTYKYV